jgi:hypothetical protein
VKFSINSFGDYILTLVRGCAIIMILWGGLLLVLFIIIGLLIGIAQVILGGQADILIKYTAILLIAAVLYQTFSYITSDPEDNWKAPHECT